LIYNTANTLATPLYDAHPAGFFLIINLFKVSIMKKTRTYMDKLMESETPPAGAGGFF